ncbi:MAG: phosphoribosyltransferase family protein [Arthrobacter sp.]|uniref:ComF family protein n=1 Tax=Arthrobacter sp. UYCu512 TaxID=3156338 RepID=UPI0032784FC4
MGTAREARGRRGARAAVGHDGSAGAEPHTGARSATGAARRTQRAVDPDLVTAAASAARHRGAYRLPLARLAAAAAAAAAEVLALVAPVECVCCGAEDMPLCGGCERQVRLLMRQPFRAEAQAPALMDVDGAVILPVVAAGAYRAELAQTVLSFKSHGQRQLAEVLSKGLARAIRDAAGESRGLLLVPVPTSSSAYRKRGFSPIHVLLGRAGRPRGPGAGQHPGFTIVHALRKTRPPFPACGPSSGGQGGQKGLGRRDRVQRVQGTMRVRRWPFNPGVDGRACIIVDDVLTTGATLAEASRALHAAGAVVRGAVVLAATRPPVTLGFPGPDGAIAGKRPVNEKNKPKKDE